MISDAQISLYRLSYTFPGGGKEKKEKTPAFRINVFHAEIRKLFVAYTIDVSLYRSKRTGY
jgi:hypothetical protein